MDIGLLLHTRQIIRQEEAARSFEQLWEDAAQAEQLGFDHICVRRQCHGLGQSAR